MILMFVVSGGVGTEVSFFEKGYYLYISGSRVDNLEVCFELD